jgi:general secretion pathway protein J
VTASEVRQAEARRGSRSSAGFTLIELLIAMTLFALLSVALVGGLRFGTRVWETGHERSTAFNGVEIVHSFLHQRLNEARLSVLGQRGERSDREFSGFNGALDHIEFIAPLPQHVGLGGLYHFQLSRITSGGLADMVLSWELYRPGQGEAVDEDAISRRVLLEGIESLKFRFYGSLGTSRGPQWHDEWAGQRRLPRLIAIDLEFPQGDLRFWPAFIAAPAASQDGFEP